MPCHPDPEEEGDLDARLALVLGRVVLYRGRGPFDRREEAVLQSASTGSCRRTYGEPGLAIGPVVREAEKEGFEPSKEVITPLTP